MRVKLAVVTLLLCLPCIHSVLYQLNRDEILCPKDEVQLFCSQNVGLINWELSNSLGSVLLTGSSGREEDQLGTSVVTANFTCSRSQCNSYLSVAVGNIRELLVTCEEQILNVTSFNYETLISYQLSLSPLNTLDLFIAVWPPLPAGLPQLYTLTSTSPSYPAVSISTSNSSAILQLRNATQYNITLDSNICMGFTSSFVVGECVFIEASQSYDVRYLLQLNQSAEASIDHKEGNLHLVCASNGEWTIVANNTHLNESEFRESWPATDETVSREYYITNITAETDNEVLIRERSSNCVTVVSSISVLSILLMVVIGIATFVLGMLFGRKFKDRGPLTANGRATGPIYEEVLHHQKAAMTISVNEAYGDVGELKNNRTYEN